MVSNRGIVAAVFRYTLNAIIKDCTFEPVAIVKANLSVVCGIVCWSFEFTKAANFTLIESRSRLNYSLVEVQHVEKKIVRLRFRTWVKCRKTHIEVRCLCSPTYCQSRFFSEDIA
jgi:hypothetical protein